MSLDEALFKLAWRIRNAVRRDPAQEAERGREARLAELHTPLTLVARALSGEPLEISEAEQVGGFAGDVLYLPGRIPVGGTPRENALVYLYRLAYTVTSRQWGFTLPAGNRLPADFQTFCTLAAVPPTLRRLEATLPMTRDLRTQLFPLLLRNRAPCPTPDTVAARLEALTQALLGNAFPGPPTSTREPWPYRRIMTATRGWSESELHDLWRQFRHGARPLSTAPVAPVVLWGQLMPARPGNPHSAPGDGRGLASPSFPGGTELPGKPKEQVRRVSLDQRDIDNDTLVQPFDKIDTAEEFSGVTRTPDGADELARHAEALEELDLREVVRSDTPTHSIYKADLMLDADTGDVETTAPLSSAAFVYDEWEGRSRQYRTDWCTVYVSRPPALPDHDAKSAAVLRQYARVVRDVRLLLDKLRFQRVLRNRQPEGAEIDLDAVVDRYATVSSGHQPDDRLYLARRRHARDWVTLLLIDMSSSTDAWIQGVRVLDVARESALVLGEVLAQWNDRVGMAGFYSHTRRDCRFVVVKPFDAEWQGCRAALLGLEPTGYTRIGPALRHGIALLQRQRAARKLLLLLSDGKPTDYDRYEGRYGIADVRQAIREAHQAHIHTYALAIDVQAKLYLPQMFGSGSFQILPHPTHLVRGLAELYSQLAR